MILSKTLKKSFRLFVILFLLFTINAGFAQEEKTSFKKENRKQAKEQINKLKSGVLLVRLSTKKNKIEALKKAEKQELAIQTEEDQRSFNLNLVEVFQRVFNFCPVYFFYSDQSKSVEEKQFESVEFLNKDLLPDSSIKFNNQPFLIAEFGLIERNETNGGSEMPFEALLIRNDKFVQLRRPFPYYVRTLSLFGIRATYTVIHKMNRKLFKFHSKANSEV